MIMLWHTQRTTESSPINVVRPAGISPDAKLPTVAQWIFGGGFELGSPQMYDGATIVSRSIELNELLIYVLMSYRVTAFGFLASQEVKGASIGNLGLQDPLSHSDAILHKSSSEKTLSVATAVEHMQSNGNGSGRLSSTITERRMNSLRNELVFGTKSLRSQSDTETKGYYYRTQVHVFSFLASFKLVLIVSISSIPPDYDALVDQTAFSASDNAPP
ncbi:hypothetical protein D9758_004311 [Tetrapyrgos nigripes]|uniref:Carboxylesterase type B domain-containing protein n=1 Tax=Tetrapyrgos nigripes TaxID=182062 RepID=A0A8H5GUI7_9AGAR|nr:hypothetical protein D9758_004311 [Tetrapyrgos nigripes]